MDVVPGRVHQAEDAAAPPVLVVLLHGDQLLHHLVAGRPGWGIGVWGNVAMPSFLVDRRATCARRAARPRPGGPRGRRDLRWPMTRTGARADSPERLFIGRRCASIGAPRSWTPCAAISEQRTGSRPAVSARLAGGVGTLVDPVRGAAGRGHRGVPSAMDRGRANDGPLPLRLVPPPSAVRRSAASRPALRRAPGRDWLGATDELIRHAISRDPAPVPDDRGSSRAAAWPARDVASCHVVAETAQLAGHADSSARRSTGQDGAA